MKRRATETFTNKWWVPLASVVVLTSGCSLQEPSRVQKDFGVSVRTMVAEQIYDPATAHEPQVLGPETLGGNAANAAIKGYEAASREARRERQVTNQSPLPVVGTVSATEE